MRFNRKFTQQREKYVTICNILRQLYTLTKLPISFLNIFTINHLQIQSFFVIIAVSRQFIMIDLKFAGRGD